MPPEKQSGFFGGSLALIIFAFLTLGKDTASIVALLMIGLSMMAAYHHEWCNGKRNLYGLCEDAMPLEKAYAIIRGESSTHFDPMVVKAFFAASEGIQQG